ncbi:hypothetical protein [Thauera butanivorans]|uniref:hypothetical protein n=1 Tax=Thauera butanivorans TaxID=86174 RepID=UPI000A8A97DC|nr:hypothetical protein [Thauera butanivorans]
MSLASSSGPVAPWPEISPPLAPREEHEIRQLGRTRIDAYAWMKFIPQSGSRTLEQLPPPLREHLEAEMSYAREVLRPLGPGIEEFRARMAARAPEISEPLPRSDKGWCYSFKLPAGRSHRVFSRAGPDG